ncbi:MAG: Biotin-requiring enzyme [Solirubrobacteraceae bacterium]|jgi:pyruvate/2-oxoglutarate dehydrogenase complex dihydrolipoamide acyltransferase (E2) component|nr:Biotin-requiring enzyme [Solirubrobacteraceae bacterium]
MTPETVDVFIPNAGVGGSRECTVIACDLQPGGEVTAGEVLARLRSGCVDLGVEAPLSGTLVTLHARDGARMRVGDLLAEIVPGEPRTARKARARSVSSQTLIQRAPLGAAIAISATALAWPVAVLVVSALAGIIIAALRDTQLRGGVTGSADVVVAPLRLLRSIARVSAKALTISRLVPGLARLAYWLALALALPAALACLAWLATESADGLVAAMRMAACGYALQILAVLVSFWILRRALDFEGIASPLRSLLERLPEAALSGTVVAGLVWIVACAVVIPSRSWAPASSFQGVVQTLPAGLRDSVNDLRVSIVAAEARSVVSCLSRHDRRGWRDPRAFVADDGTLLVGVRPYGAQPPSKRSFAVLVLALQNQLANSSANVAVVPQAGAKAVAFDTFDAKRPVTDLGRILERVTVAGSSAPPLPDPSHVRPEDVETALTCSAAAG